MSFFGDANRDAYSVSPDAAATGPLVGFFESWRVGMDAQMRASAQFGIEYYMQELDWNQTRAMLEAGIETPPQLILGLEGSQPGEGRQSVAQMLRNDSGYYEDFVPERSAPYLNVARRYAGEAVDDPEFEQRLRAYDERIAQIREERPELELMTSEEMFGRVRDGAQAAESRLDNDRRTWGGAFGGFFGGALGAMHPGTDPLNFYSLGIGGAGRTALQRILAQTGGQGVIEAVNQVTGVQEERRILGLSHGFQDAAQRVAATALGAGALQGVGEVAVAGARRLFTSRPNDPAPDMPGEAPREPLVLPPPERLREEAQTIRLEQDGRAYADILAQRAPLSGIRMAEPRIVADLGDMTRQLVDWTGGSPAAIGARTANVTLPGEARLPRADGIQAAVDNARLYQLAKEADPEAFRQYEQLIERRNTYRRWVEELAQGRDADVQQTMRNMEARLHALEARHRTTQGKTNKLRIREQIAEIKKDREALIAASQVRETPDIAQVRRELVKVDGKMQEIAPLIGRAYSRARGRWGETAEELDAVWEAYREGRGQPEMPPNQVLPDYDTAMMSLADRAPIMRQASKVEPRATSADTARAIVAENAKVIDDALTVYRDEVKRLVDVAPNGKLKIEGREYEFDLDRDTMFVPHDKGTGGREVTMREYLAEVRRAEDELEAVSVCSTR